MKNIDSFIILAFLVLIFFSCGDDDVVTVEPELPFESTFELTINGETSRYTDSDSGFDFCDYNGLIARDYQLYKLWENDTVTYIVTVTNYDVLRTNGWGISQTDFYLRWHRFQVPDASLPESVREVEAGSTVRVPDLRIGVSHEGSGYYTFLTYNDRRTVEDPSADFSLSIRMMEEVDCSRFQDQVMEINYEYSGYAYKLDYTDSIFIDQAKLVTYAPAYF